MNFKYTYNQANGHTATGYVDLSKAVNVDFITIGRDTPDEDGTLKQVQVEAAIITFPTAIQKPAPQPVYKPLNKVQRLKGAVPEISHYSSQLQWMNYTVIIDREDEVAALKNIYNNTFVA